MFRSSSRSIPYRGCANACTYCGWGETPVLMADGRTRRLDKLRVGDEIYGTRRVGVYRRFVRSRVLAHWSVIKPAFRTTLEDGTTLVTSGDHRFLSDRGWKFVTGTEQGKLPQAASDNFQQADGHWGICRGCESGRGLSAWLPVRNDSRRRPHRRLRVSAQQTAALGSFTSSVSRCATGRARTSTELPARLRHLHLRICIPGGRRRQAHLARHPGVIDLPSEFHLPPHCPAASADAGVEGGLPRRHIRRRRKFQPDGAAHQQHRQQNHRLDRRVSAGLRVQICS